MNSFYPKKAVYTFTTKIKLFYKVHSSSKQNSSDARFSSDLIQGSEITLVYFEPREVQGKGKISISKVVHGYKNLFSSSFSRGRTEGTSLPCNVDVNCPEGQPWKAQSNSVALIIVDGEKYGSGFLINTGDGGLQPYFMTADHVYKGATNVGDWIFRFQYKRKSSDCNNSSASDPNSYISYNGAYLVARDEQLHGADITILKLKQRPAGNTGITYAGISQSIVPPVFPVGISHPVGDVMKIAFDIAGIPERSIVLNSAHSPDNDSYWKLQFEIGTVEHGSSGSPLFNAQGQAVGVLSAGASVRVCDTDRLYGILGEAIENMKEEIPAAFLPTLLPQSTPTTGIPFMTATDEGLMCDGETRTFTMNNVPAGLSVFWSHSSNLSNTSSNNGMTYTVQALPNTQGSDGRVEAFVYGGGGSSSYKKGFWIGKPLISLGGSGGVEQVPQNIRSDVFVSYLGANDQGVTEVTWSYQPVVTDAYGSKHKGRFTTGDDLGYGTVLATAKNACGTYTARLNIEVVEEDNGCYCCGGPPYCYRVSPNPTNDSFTIDFDEGVLPLHLRNQEIRLVLYNKMLTIKKEFTMQGLSKTIDVRDLPADVYILQITIGNEETFETKIIVLD